MSDVQRLAVLGCGQMGVGIAFVAAVHARVSEIALVDISIEKAQQGRDELEKLVRRTAKYRRIEPRLVDPILQSVRLVDGIEKLDSFTPDLVIEAAAEDLEIKKRLFAQLAKHVPLRTILASNTSSLSITHLARAAADAYEETDKANESAARVVGIHYFNPVPVMRLVEIVPALQTSDAVVQRATDFAVACRKRTVLCVDTPGFIVNRINIAAVREAIRMVESKTATHEDIDKAMVLGMRQPMGPLRLADFVGLVRDQLTQDICLQYVHGTAHAASWRPSTKTWASRSSSRPCCCSAWCRRAGWASSPARYVPPLTPRASTTTARRPNCLVIIGPAANERRALTKPPFCSRIDRREEKPCRLRVPWTTSARAVSPSTGATCSTSMTPSGARWSASTGAFRRSHSNGNKYWENVEEQPGRTRWVDFASHDFDTTQQEPIWHAWLAHTRMEPPSTDPTVQRFHHHWEAVRGPRD